MERRKKGSLTARAARNYISITPRQMLHSPARKKKKLSNFFHIHRGAISTRASQLGAGRNPSFVIKISARINVRDARSSRGDLKYVTPSIWISKSFEWLGLKLGGGRLLA